MAGPNNSGKTMSSRLLTMKFMQRGTASSPSPSSNPERPAKKQRLSNGNSQSSPAATPRSDAQAVQEALAEEERKRSLALEREAADKGETKWYFSYKSPITPAQQSPLRFVTVGYAALDQNASESGSDNDADDVRPQVPGRKSFGRFNKSLEKEQNPGTSYSSDSDSPSFDEENEDEEEDLEDDPTGAKALIAQARREAAAHARAERKARKKADNADAARLADDRRKKQVNLNRLSSISGFGSSPGSPKTNITCHKCGNKGHIQRDCPQGPPSKRMRQ